MTKLLTANEAAKILRVTRVTVYNYTRRGLIRACRVGSRIRYREDEIARLIDLPDMPSQPEVILKLAPEVTIKQKPPKEKIWL